jgi:hypothetical protein
VGIWTSFGEPVARWSRPERPTTAGREERGGAGKGDCRSVERAVFGHSRDDRPAFRAWYQPPSGLDRHYGLATRAHRLRIRFGHFLTACSRYSARDLSTTRGRYPGREKPHSRLTDVVARVQSYPGRSRDARRWGQLARDEVSLGGAPRGGGASSVTGPRSAHATRTSRARWSRTGYGDVWPPPPPGRVGRAAAGYNDPRGLHGPPLVRGTFSLALGSLDVQGGTRVVVVPRRLRDGSSRPRGSSGRQSRVPVRRGRVGREPSMAGRARGQGSFGLVGGPRDLPGSRPPESSRLPSGPGLWSAVTAPGVPHGR